VAPLARWRGLSSLTYIGISGVDEGIVQVIQSPLFAARTLHLDRCGLGVRQAEQIARAARMSKVRALLLPNSVGQKGPRNQIDDDAANIFASSPHFKELEELDLWANPLGDRGVESLLAGLGSLRKMILWATALTPAGYQRLRGGPCWLHSDHEHRIIEY